MFANKLALVGLFLFPLTQNAVAAIPPNEMLESTIQIMRICYEKEHKTGAQLAQCMANVFTKIPNPDNYKINLSGDVPGDFVLVLYNQAGYTIKCALAAQKIIAVKQCTSYQRAPLTPGQELSIEPPRE